MDLEQEIEQTVFPPTEVAAAKKPSGPVIRKGKKPSAWKMLIYGNAGVGKSTLAANAPDPFFIDLEAGLDQIDIPAGTPERVVSYELFIDWLRWFTGSEHQTVVIDTIDELENMLTRKVCEKAKRETLVDIPYGKGGDLLVLEWQRVIDIFEIIRSRGKNVLLTGHEKIEKFEDPTTENYDRYQLKLHKKTAPLVTAKMDAVLFARIETVLRERDGSDKKRAVSTGQRVLHTVEGACWIAKNRFRLEPVIPMDAGLFELIK